MKRIKPLILDTTFILPLFGIQIDLSEDFQKKVQDIWNNRLKGFNVYLPSICLMETMFKLLNEYRKGNDLEILNRYQIILHTILDLPIEIFNCEINPKASSIASIIRHSGHLDIMDCWIAGAAVALGGMLLSEDTELILALKEIPETKDLIVWSWSDFISEKIEKKTLRK
jgi:predicted nucleic acid-binding protein